MHPKPIEQRALSGHAAADDAGQIRTEPNPGTSTSAAEERGSSTNLDLLQPWTAVQSHVRGVLCQAQTTISGSFETDAHPRIACDKPLAQRFDARACELHPRIPLAELVNGVGIACVKERLPVVLHEGKQEFPGFLSRFNLLGKLVVTKLISGEQAARKSLEDFTTHLPEYAVLPLKVRCERDVRPWRVGPFTLRPTPIERLKDLLGISRRKPKGAMFPRRTSVHDCIVERKVALSADLRIEEKEQMDSVRAIVDVGLETGEDGVNLLSEGNTVVVLATVPLVDDLPDRTGLGSASGPRGVRCQPGDLYAARNQSLEKQSRVA